MQIGTKQFFQTQVTSMNDLQSQIGKIQEQVSSGKSILVPSDNPGGYTTAARLSRSEASIQQYSRNISVAKSRLGQEDTVLSSSANILSRLNELTIAGSNGTNSQASRTAIADEMTQLSDQLMALGNTKDPNGDYLFGGYKTKNPPFITTADGVAYVGDTGRKEVELAQGFSTPTSSNGNEIFMNASRDASGKPISIFQVIKNATTQLATGNLTSDNVSQIQTAIDHNSAYQSICGSRLQKVDNIDQNSQDLLLNVQQDKSAIEDADLTKLATELQQKTLTLNASESVFAKVAQLSLFNYLK
jgi:flagellar hook-associated protein 3 FlgL